MLIFGIGQAVVVGVLISLGELEICYHMYIRTSRRILDNVPRFLLLRSIGQFTIICSLHRLYEFENNL
jgi:hypothetical protein